MKHALTGALLCMAFGAAAEPTEQDVIAMLERAAAYTKANGRAQMIQKITAKDPDYVQGTMYIYMRDFNSGINLAHPFNQSIVGKDQNDVPDTNGKMYRRDIMDVAHKEGKGWVDYMYKNPENNQIEAKSCLRAALGRRDFGGRHLQEIGAPFHRSDRKTSPELAWSL